jgi:hypothetical protein
MFLIARWLILAGDCFWTRPRYTKHSVANFIEPMLLLPAETLLEGPGWAYELKLDGDRATPLGSRPMGERGSGGGKGGSNGQKPLHVARCADLGISLIPRAVLRIAPDSDVIES